MMIFMFMMFLLLKEKLLVLMIFMMYFLSFSLVSNFSNISLSISLVIFMLMLVFFSYKFEYNKSLLVLMSLVFSLVLFNTKSMLVFFFMFELTVIFLMVYIVMFGKSFNKISSAMYLLFYTIGFSFLFFIGMMMLLNEFGTLNFLLICMEEGKSLITALMLVLVFLVKLPLMIIHIWLPKAHVDSPIEGSMVLAGVTLKMGSYGILLLMNQIFVFFYLINFFLSWALVSCLIMVFFCFLESDLKKIIAYSSVSHMSVLFLSMCSNSQIGLQAAILMMISHGIYSPMMFWSMGEIYKKSKVRNLNSLFGMNIMSKTDFKFMMLSFILNMGFPPFIGFVGEFLFIFSFIKKSYYFIIPLFIILSMFGFYNIYNNSKVNIKNDNSLLFMEKYLFMSSYFAYYMMFFFVMFFSLNVWFI